MAKRGAQRLQLGIALREYLVIWLLGTIVGLRFWWARFVRRSIQVNGYHHLRDAARQGHLIIVANHPSLVEPMLIPALGWPRMYLSRRYFFWSMPDRRLFPRGTKWIHAITRGIEVDRSLPGSMYNARAINRAKTIVQQGDIIVIHAEGGRTYKWHEAQRQWHARPPQLLQSNGRELGEINPAILRLAIKSNARILPLWIDMPSKLKQPRSFPKSLLILLLGKYDGMTFNFDHAAYQPLTSDPVAEARLLEQLLLNPANNSFASIRDQAAAVS